VGFIPARHGGVVMQHPAGRVVQEDEFLVAVQCEFIAGRHHNYKMFRIFRDIQEAADNFDKAMQKGWDTHDAT
jgi:hypothetical protein